MGQNDVAGRFRRTWRAEVLAAQPMIAPARHFTFPRAVPGEEEAMARGALELMVRPDAGGVFLATCALGFRSESLPTGLWSCPRAEQMCALAGGYAYLIDTDHPEVSTQIPLKPVTAVRAIEEAGLLIFAGFHTIAAWGEDGLRWQSARLSWEGLTLGNVVDGRLTGQGWDMKTDRELPFSIDLQTGVHEGGGYLR